MVKTRHYPSHRCEEFKVVLSGCLVPPHSKVVYHTIIHLKTALSFALTRVISIFYFILARIDFTSVGVTALALFPKLLRM